ncbi:hypothetical protein RFI_29720 [Reticulomyxa filosa]|uniref:Uncharacterized protein n=1 Tax=Reticulomyxa filosa TaxID=46433 RepID=X6M3R7_RETFI|nr:hypothetical protein RFI_29720 [Reticulomyxa filosa]|eukprot:ETO07670.1 hypothetical protein RFI_29720 [Reticulomyxa filosa]
MLVEDSIDSGNISNYNHVLELDNNDNGQAPVTFIIYQFVICVYVYRQIVIVDQWLCETKVRFEDFGRLCDSRQQSIDQLVSAGANRDIARIFTYFFVGTSDDSVFLKKVLAKKKNVHFMFMYQDQNGHNSERLKLNSGTELSKESSAYASAAQPTLPAVVPKNASIKPKEKEEEILYAISLAFIFYHRIIITVMTMR